MNSLKKINFKANSIVFFQGDIEAHFYIIESGKISISYKNKMGETKEIARLQAGEIFGEQALIDRSERSATALALTDCTLFQVSESDYESMLKELPLWASSMLKSFSSRLKRMNQLQNEKPKN